jgi:hypothetical protein
MPPEEHVLGDYAETWCKLLLPREWTKVKSGNPEYGVDLFVEVFKDGEPTGLLFSVQVKYCTKIGERYVRQPIKTKKLRQYRQRREPVFLVVVDPPSQS